MFLVLLGVGNLDLMFRLDPNPSPLREVVPFPRPHLNRSLVHWPGELLWYLQSSMGFRPALVRARGLLAWNWLHGSPAPSSVVRADPWLFMRSERVLEDFRRVDPFTDAELATWSEVLERRRVWLGEPRLPLSDRGASQQGDGLRRGDAVLGHAGAGTLASRSS